MGEANQSPEAKDKDREEDQMAEPEGETARARVRFHRGWHQHCSLQATSRSISWSAVKQTRDKESNSMLKAINKRRGGFTLVEIMIVVAIIALLAAIAVPGFLRARKRSQASRILNDLRMIDSAVDQYAIETNRKTGDVVGVADWTNYLKKGSLLYNNGKSLLGTAYGTQTVDTIPQVPAADYTTLSDVASTGFWSPYGP